MYDLLQVTLVNKRE